MSHRTATRPAVALALGTLAVGVLDGADALLFFGLRGVAPERIFQSIASGLLGRDAYAGGATAVALGVALHFLIAFLIVGGCYLLSRRIPLLTRRPLAAGIAYGIAAWCVMNAVVVPLSAAVTGPLTWPVVVNGLAIHALGVGLPSTLAARAATPRRG